MIILHICDWYRPIGGAEKLLFDTLKLLEDAGHTNVIVYNRHPDQEKTGKRPEYACKGLEVHWPGTFVMKNLVVSYSRRRLHHIINKQKPDVCHIHNLQNSYVTEYLIKKLPTVRSIHDPRLYCFTWWRLLPDKRICPYPMGKECLQQGCLSPGRIPRTIHDLNARWAMRNYRAHKKMPVLIGESRAQIECMLENSYRPEQIAWLPNFTPLRSEATAKAFVRRHYDPSERIALFVGRASYEKGLGVLLNAVKYLKSNCKVVLVTAGPELEDIQRQAAAYNDRVKVIPGLPYKETRRWYARASVVVVPSVWLESFCLIGLEAYANMKPVIGSRIGGIKDWLKDGQTGWFFKPGNAKQLAARIDQAMADPKKTEAMGLAGYRRAKEYYSKEQYLPRLLRIYERAISAFG